MLRMTVGGKAYDDSAGILVMCPSAQEVLFYLCFVVSRWGKTEFLCYICRIYKRENKPNRIISNVEKIICSSSAGRVLRGIRSEKRNPA